MTTNKQNVTAALTARLDAIHPASKPSKPKSKAELQREDQEAKDLDRWHLLKFGPPDPGDPLGWEDPKERPASELSVAELRELEALERKIPHIRYQRLRSRDRGFEGPPLGPAEKVELQALEMKIPHIRYERLRSRDRGFDHPPLSPAEKIELASLNNRFPPDPLAWDDDDRGGRSS